MPWPLIAAAAVTAVSTIYGGVSSSNAASAEAERAQQYGAYNAMMAKAQAKRQSGYTMMTAMYNASAARRNAQFNVSQNTAWTDYNVDLLETAAIYRDQLYDNEIDQVMEELDFAGAQLEKDYAKALGSEKARQSASGTTMGIGSNAGLEQEIMIEEQLFAAVLERNADERVASINNSKAKDGAGGWETHNQVNKLMFEGQLSNVSMTYNANANANATLFGGMINARSQAQSGSNTAASILSGASQTAANQNAQSSLYMTQGLMSGASSLATAYGQYAGSTIGDDSLMSGGQ